MSNPPFTVRPYRPSDEEGVRGIYGDDESERLRRHPGYGRYLADSMSHYWDFEPESVFAAIEEGRVAGALLGAVDSERVEKVYEPRNFRRVLRRFLAGRYGWPGWSYPIAIIEWANRHRPPPRFDLADYPAHLHIGIRPGRRRRGMGTALMRAFESHLRDRGVPGHHLYCSDFHPLGLAFYRKLRLTEIGSFRWLYHDGDRLREVTEHVFVQRV